MTCKLFHSEGMGSVIWGLHMCNKFQTSKVIALDNFEGQGPSVRFECKEHLSICYWNLMKLNIHYL